MEEIKLRIGWSWLLGWALLGARSRETYSSSLRKPELFYLFLKKYLLIYLAVLGLSCGTLDL